MTVWQQRSSKISRCLPNIKFQQTLWDSLHHTRPITESINKDMQCSPWIIVVEFDLNIDKENIKSNSLQGHNKSLLVGQVIGGPADKERLFSKLREENNFLKQVCSKKHESIVSLKSKKIELISLLKNADLDIKAKTQALIKLKEAIEEAQQINVVCNL